MYSKRQVGTWSDKNVARSRCNEREGVVNRY